VSFPREIVSRLDHGSGKLEPREASRQSIDDGHQNAFNMAIGINNHAFEDCGCLAGILGGWVAGTWRGLLQTSGTSRHSN
jgi:hypothetical protein